MSANYAHMLIDHIPDQIYNTLYVADEIYNKLIALGESEPKQSYFPMTWHVYSYFSLFTRVINAYAYYCEKRSTVKETDKIKLTDIKFERFISVFDNVVANINSIIDMRDNLQPEVVNLMQEKANHLREHLVKMREEVDNYIEYCYLKSFAYKIQIKEN